MLAGVDDWLECEGTLAQALLTPTSTTYSIGYSRPLMSWPTLLFARETKNTVRRFLLMADTIMTIRICSVYLVALCSRNLIPLRDMFIDGGYAVG